MLKIVKTRLRASLGNDKLETFMLMSSEKDVLDSITVDDLIHELIKDSQFFAKMLLLQSYFSWESTDYCMLMFVHVGLGGTLFSAVQRSTHLT